MRKSILWSLALMLCAATAFADPVPYDITGEVRVRNENDNRDFDSDTGYKSFNLMRTRLGVNVRPAEDVNVFVQVQDSRVQGVEPSSTTPGVQEDTKLDLHQGFFEVNNLGWNGFGVKAGRMQVRWGNERLIGVNDWDNVSRAFDGVMASVSTERVNVQTLFANLVERDTPAIGAPETENSDATLQGAYGSISVAPNANADVFVINVRDKVTPSDDDDMNVLTLGTRVHGKAASQFDYSVEGSFQTGSQETGPATQLDVSGFMFGGEVGMSLGSEARPVRIAAGYDYLSGDEDGAANGKLEAFDTLFDDSHKFYGLMDLPQLASSAGLQDVKLDVTGTVFQNENNVVRLGGEFHNFRLAKAGTGEATLGNEVDVHASWAYRNRFVPTLGLSAFLPSDAIPGSTPGSSADNSYWIYAQGVVSF